jgi:hypothetical protein
MFVSASSPAVLYLGTGGSWTELHNLPGPIFLQRPHIDMARSGGNITQCFNNAQPGGSKEHAKNSRQGCPYFKATMTAAVAGIASLSLRQYPPPPLVDPAACKAMYNLTGGWRRTLMRGRLSWAGDSFVNRTIVKLIYPMFPFATSFELTVSQRGLFIA